MTRGGDGRDMGGVEDRFGRLEQDVSNIKADLKSIGELVYLRGWVETLPTTIQVLGLAVAVFVAASVMVFGR